MGTPERGMVSEKMEGFPPVIPPGLVAVEHC